MSFPERPWGQRFAGLYELKGALGQGSNAVVYKAIDTEAKKPVAIKVFNPDAVDSDTVSHEARIQARLRHPHILPYRWHGVADWHGDSYPFIAMMYARQGSLAERIKIGKRLATSDTVQILNEAADGMEYAHAVERVIHRDLKPSNILLHREPDGIVKISDWGIAKKVHDIHTDVTKELSFPVTAPYAAPEQIAGKSTIATDIYSLGGVVAFELLTGARPFEADNSQGYLIAHLTSSPPLFEDVLGARMTPLLAAIEPPVQKALSKSPQERQRSMGEYADELRRAYEKATGVIQKDNVIIDLKAKPNVPDPKVPTDPSDQTMPKDRETLAAYQTALRVQLGRVNQTLQEQETDPLLQAEMANPMIERAKEILGKDFMGIEALRAFEHRL
jgi:serine/threonine protein kinase